MQLTMKEKAEAIAKKLVCDVLGVRWIVSTGERDKGELGLKIGPVQMWYYKWADPLVTIGKPYRIANKREFGEVVKSKLL